MTDVTLERGIRRQPGTICDRCMSCVAGCSPGAIVHIREGKTVRIRIEDTTCEWADIDLGKCALSYHGGDAAMSPFIHKSFPGWNIDVTQLQMSEETAYKFGWTLSTASWRATDEFPEGADHRGARATEKVGRRRQLWG